MLVPTKMGIFCVLHFTGQYIWHIVSQVSLNLKKKQKKKNKKTIKIKEIKGYS